MPQAEKSSLSPSLARIGAAARATPQPPAAPRAAFPSRSHAGAIRQVLEAIDRREPLIVAIGGPGSGKTTLCLALRQHADDHVFVTTVFDPRLTPTQLLTRLLRDWGVISEHEGGVLRDDRERLQSAAGRFLVSLTSIGARCVVVIDDAEQLPSETLEQLDAMVHLPDDASACLRLVLVGRASLETQLKRSKLKAVTAGKVLPQARLVGLEAAEIVPYVQHRQRAHVGGPSGGREPDVSARLDARAVARILEQTGGVPALVDDAVSRVLDDSVPLEPDATTGFGETWSWPRLLLVPAFAALLLGVGISLWWRSSRPGSSLAPPPTAEPLSARTRTQEPTPRPTAAASPEAAAPQPASLSSAEPTGTAAPSPSVAPEAIAARTDPEPASRPREAAAIGTTGQPAPGARGYRLIVASFRVRENAEAAVAALTALRIAPDIATITDERWHRVVVGPFQTLGEVGAAQQALAEAGYTDTVVSETPTAR